MFHLKHRVGYRRHNLLARSYLPDIDQPVTSKIPKQSEKTIGNF
jgi:hypothetical protein